mmetsp:Transcript_29593/g.84529  ORF Transcript_29593/g.84529 Transcript_29593/m.84529 type:complete len:341 (-) Transcript_29593:703-1725(-)
MLCGLPAAAPGAARRPGRGLRGLVAAPLGHAGVEPAQPGALDREPVGVERHEQLAQRRPEADHCADVEPQRVWLAIYHVARAVCDALPHALHVGSIADRLAVPSLQAIQRKAQEGEGAANRGCHVLDGREGGQYPRLSPLRARGDQGVLVHEPALGGDPPEREPGETDSAEDAPCQEHVHRGGEDEHGKDGEGGVQQPHGHDERQEPPVRLAGGVLPPVAAAERPHVHHVHHRLRAARGHAGGQDHGAPLGTVRPEHVGDVVVQHGADGGAVGAVPELQGPHVPQGAVPAASPEGLAPNAHAGHLGLPRCGLRVLDSRAISETAPGLTHDWHRHQAYQGG